MTTYRPFWEPYRCPPLGFKERQWESAIAFVNAKYTAAEVESAGQDREVLLLYALWIARCPTDLAETAIARRWTARPMMGR